MECFGVGVDLIGGGVGLVMPALMMMCFDYVLVWVCLMLCWWVGLVLFVVV